MPRRDSVLRRIEAMGIRSTELHWSLMPPDLARRVRPRVEHVGDGLATLMRKSDSLRMNRVIGFGHRGAAKKSMVDDLIDLYRDAKLKRFSIQLGPGPQAAAITSWLSRRGFERHGGTVLLLRDCRGPVPRVKTTARVARARRAQYEAVFEIMAESFGMPRSRSSWSLAALAAGHNETYVAFIGDQPAGTGTLRAQGNLVWLGAGATRPRWRKRGVHGALIAARLKRAAALRCRWAWSEAAEPRPGSPDGSRRNLMRMGFEEVFVKPIFVWSDET